MADELFKRTVATAHDALIEVKQRSGLTWAQMAIIFGVSARSIHLWLEEEAMAVVMLLHQNKRNTMLFPKRMKAG